MIPSDIARLAVNERTRPSCRSNYRTHIKPALRLLTVGAGRLGPARYAGWLRRLRRWRGPETGQFQPARCTVRLVAGERPLVGDRSVHADGQVHARLGGVGARLRADRVDRSSGARVDRRVVPFHEPFEAARVGDYLVGEALVLAEFF